MLKDKVELECFTVISIDFSFVYENKYYLRLYSDNCGYKAVDKQLINYLDDNLFEADKD